MKNSELPLQSRITSNNRGGRDALDYVARCECVVSQHLYILFDDVAVFEHLVPCRIRSGRASPLFAVAGFLQSFSHVVVAHVEVL